MWFLQRIENSYCYFCWCCLCCCCFYCCCNCCTRIRVILLRYWFWCTVIVFTNQFIVTIGLVQFLFGLTTILLTPLSACEKWQFYEVKSVSNGIRKNYKLIWNFVCKQTQRVFLCYSALCEAFEDQFGVTEIPFKMLSTAFHITWSFQNRLIYSSWWKLYKVKKIN